MRIVGLGLVLLSIGCSAEAGTSSHTSATSTSSTGSGGDPMCAPQGQVAFDPANPGSASVAPGAHCERDIDCAVGSYCVVVSETCADPKKLQGAGLGGHAADGSACMAAPAFPTTCDGTALGWSAPTDVSKSAGSLAESDTAVVADGHGKVLVAWSNDTKGPRQQFNGLALSTDDGATFSPIAAPTHATTDAENDAALAVDAEGLFYYVWEGYANDFQGAQHVFSSQSSDGATWTTPIQIDTPSDGMNGSLALDFPSVAINPVNQRPYYTYQVTATSGPVPLRLVVGAKGGATVGPSVALDDGKRATPYRDLANGVFDANGSYYAAWTELTGGSSGMGLESGAASSAVYFTRVDLGASDALAPLGHDVMVSTHGEPILFGIPQILTTPDGASQYVVYETGTKDAIDVRVATSHDRGQSWGASVKVNDDPSCATHYDASATLDERGRLWVLFYDNRDGAGHLVYAMSDDGGQSFHANRLVSPNGFPFETFQYSVGWLGDYFGVTARGGSLYAAWSDPHDNDQSHIQFAKSTLPP